MFSSVLKTEYYSDLESLLFLNPQQGRVQLGISESLERFGQPEILVGSDFLQVKVGSISDVQTLFAFDNYSEIQKPELAGVMIYVRTDDENIVVLHVAVAEDYCLAGRYGDERLLKRFLVMLRKIAHRIKGVRSIEIIYAKRVARMAV